MYFFQAEFEMHNAYYSFFSEKNKMRENNVFFWECTSGINFWETCFLKQIYTDLNNPISTYLWICLSRWKALNMFSYFLTKKITQPLVSVQLPFFLRHPFDHFSLTQPLLYFQLPIPKRHLFDQLRMHKHRRDNLRQLRSRVTIFFIDSCCAAKYFFLFR